MSRKYVDCHRTNCVHNINYSCCLGIVTIDKDGKCTKFDNGDTCPESVEPKNKDIICG